MLNFFPFYGRYHVKTFQNGHKMGRGQEKEFDNISFSEWFQWQNPKVRSDDVLVNGEYFAELVPLC